MRERAREREGRGDSRKGIDKKREHMRKGLTDSVREKEGIEREGKRRQ